MNPFESPGKPKHDSVESNTGSENTPEWKAEWQAEWNRQSALVEDAKARYEGMILYSPLTAEQKQAILSKLEEVQMDPGSKADVFSETRGEDETLLAALWVDRRMRRFISSLEGSMPESELELLKHALEGLTIPEENKYWNVKPGDGKWDVK
jgi:hypothetical protein